DRGGHDLAAVDDQAIADRLDELVAGDELALVGVLTDRVGLQRVRRGETNTGAGRDQTDRGADDRAAPGPAETASLGSPSMAHYLHESSLHSGAEQPRSAYRDGRQNPVAMCPAAGRMTTRKYLLHEPS